LVGYPAGKDFVDNGGISSRKEDEGDWVYWPVITRGAARIRTQISAAHNKEDLDFAIEKIAEVKQELDI